MDVLAEQETENPAAGETPDQKKGEWLKFVLDGQSYALNVLQVQEILCFDDVTPVPRAPDYVLGVINVRGNIVTVVDASRRLRLNRPERDGNEWIVILDVGGEHVGLLVDQVLEVEDVDETRIEQAPSGSPDAVNGVIAGDDDMTVLLDAHIMLGLNETAA